MRSANEIYAAFSAATRPSSREIPDHDPDGDQEREQIRDLLAPHAAREVPGEILGRHPLYTMCPLLSAASYRYYMPRFIEYCLEEPNSMLSGSLLFSLAYTHDQRDSAFSAEERGVVREYLEHLAGQPGAQLDAEDIAAAREKWREAV